MIASTVPPQASPAGSVPPAGGLTTTVAEDSDVDDLVSSIPFDVSSLFLFNVSSQYWISYTPNAPEWLNNSFIDSLDDGAIVWARRSASDSRGGLTWDLPEVVTRSAATQAAPVPPTGRVTAAAPGTTSVTELAAAQDFQVRNIFAFDVAQQRYISYTPGVPAWVNTLPENGLHPTGVVWMTRDTRDVTAAVTEGDALAAIGRVSARGNDSPNRATVAAPSSDRDSGRGSDSDSDSTPSPSESDSDSTPTPEPESTRAAAPTPARSTSGGPAMVSGADMIRHLTYEDGESEMTSDQAPPGGLGRTTEAARLGSSAGFAELEPGDPRSNAGGYRSEWHGADHISGPGVERWHGISYYFPEDFDQGDNSGTWNDRIIFQFTDEGSPMFSLHLDASSEQLWVRRKLPERNSEGKPVFETLARWDFQPGQWYDLVFHAEWTKDNSGFFEVFVDGQQRVDYEGRTLAERDVTYSKWGIYGQPTRLFFDEVWTAEGGGSLN